jgi:hypothetical protein
MPLARLLDLELLGFVYALAASIAFQLLTRRINLSGLLLHKDGSGAISPGRVQLLIATIAASASYLSQIASSKSTGLPDISSTWLYLFGGSSGIYVLEKAWVHWNEKNKNL